MRIAILSSFYPLRGGIAQFNACIHEELGRDNEVRAFNFTRQYPKALFPGKTQYVTPEDEAKPVESTAVLDTIRPSTWAKTARLIRQWQPDLLILRYWMSWFAPSLGYVARHTGCKSIAILDNVTPHEPHFFDKPLSKYFLKGCNGYITMTASVAEDLVSLVPDARYRILPHPVYSHFGERMKREDACRELGLDPERKTLLFFGLIREYKGLDILLEAFRGLPEDYQLIVAGEPYGAFDKYQRILDSLPGKDRVKVFPKYIRDSEVKLYFSAADVSVLPYRTATQSGISAASYHFDVPLIVTDVGGLRETIGDRGTGLVAPKADPEDVRKEIVRYFEDPSIAHACREAIKKEKERLSWNRFCSSLTAFAKEI
ncbi:MAG: glycosyltransferase [Bacteroidales bacterium]|nr:glycosyltransferase [Bacteroidales bacterium]